MEASGLPGDAEEAAEDALEVPKVLLGVDDAAVLGRLDVLEWREGRAKTSQ